MPWLLRLIIFWFLGLVCVHPSVELKCHLLELELAKLRELRQSLCPHPAKNPGVAWGSTCLDGPCEQGPNVVLEATVLCRERPEAMLGAAMPRQESSEVTLAQFGIL
jgi:hypothetical protein